jgi:hypothetical protein
MYLFISIKYILYIYIIEIHFDFYSFYSFSSYILFYYSSNDPYLDSKYYFSYKALFYIITYHIKLAYKVIEQEAIKMVNNIICLILNYGSSFYFFNNKYYA